jgi:dTDP-4-dehydrorhamnose reductase
MMLVTGAGGLLGRELVETGRRLGYPIVGRTHASLDVTDPSAVRACFAEEAYDLVFHCAAYTDVDGAEGEPELAMRVNRDGTRHVAHAASEAGARLVYLSTDYVFAGEGETPHRPKDPPVPEGAYGRSKLAGERVAAAVEDALIVRTGWLYGAYGRNFVDTILERALAGEPIRVVGDQRGRPTWARNLSETLLELVGRQVPAGVWHVADRGDASWAELARTAFRLCGVGIQVLEVTSDEWGAAAPRPGYSVLDLRKTEQALGRRFEPWEKALERYLSERQREREHQ